MGREKRKISSIDLIFPSFTSRPSLVTGTHSSLSLFSPRPRPPLPPRPPRPLPSPPSRSPRLLELEYKVNNFKQFQTNKIEPSSSSTSSESTTSLFSFSVSHFLVVCGDKTLQMNGTKNSQNSTDVSFAYLCKFE